MTVPIVTLTTAVITAINGQGKNLVRRYVRFYVAKDLPADGQWFAIGVDEQINKKRTTDIVKPVVDVAFQRPLPAASSQYPDPVNNLPFLDQCMDEVESVKALFREGGALAEFEFGNKWAFESMENSPIYRPDLLVENQIFTSVIRLTFLTELE